MLPKRIRVDALSVRHFEAGKGAPVLFASGNGASGYITFSVGGFTPGTYTFEWIVVTAAAKGLPPDRSAQLHDALFHHLPNRYMPWGAGPSSYSPAPLYLEP